MTESQMAQAPVRVLLVEDDEDDYVIIRDLLAESRQMRFALDWAASYQAGLEAIRRGEHDVYLFDYCLGAHNGLDLLQESVDAGGRVPVIILTSLGDQAIDMGAMEAGAADYLVKWGIDAQLLERSIRYALRHAGMLQTLSQAAGELARSNSELDHFASVVSHDLQEPLRMVSSYLSLLEEDLAGQLDDETSQFLDYALDGAIRMQTMIQALLAYARVSTRGPDLALTDSQTVLESTLWDLQIAIKESGAVITHDPLPSVVADAVQLGQVLQNLVANAIKFRGQAAPRIHISAKRGLPPLQNGSHGASEWCFSVQDNGIGLPLAHADEIFEIFRCLHTPGQYPGAGVGLAICKRIVERHGGRIWVDSRPGEGSTFYFTLPERPDLKGGRVMVSAGDRHLTAVQGEM